MSRGRLDTDVVDEWCWFVVEKLVKSVQNSELDPHWKDWPKIALDRDDGANKEW